MIGIVHHCSVKEIKKGLTRMTCIASLASKFGRSYLWRATVLLPRSARGCTSIVCNLRNTQLIPVTFRHTTFVPI